MKRFAFTTVVCTSARVLKEVSKMLDVHSVATGTMALLHWTVGTAALTRGSVGVVGWNIPLKRRTALRGDGHWWFGKLLASQMVKAGIDFG